MKRLGMLVICGLCLFGCSKGQTVDKVQEEEHEMTYEEWKAEYDEKLRRGRLDSLVTTDEEQAELDRFLEASKPHEACNGISSNDCKKDDNAIEVGMIYENFELIGSTGYMTVSSINELLDCEGKLVSEHGGHTVYQWEDRNNFKLITVGFDNGIATSKSQVGL